MTFVHLLGSVLEVKLFLWIADITEHLGLAYSSWKPKAAK